LRPRTKKEAPPKALTPHFAGFQFQHKSDKDWLAFPKKKVRHCRIWKYIIVVLTSINYLFFVHAVVEAESKG